jgi:drug/metabolite transporter (DMT)-like permease
MFKEHFDRRIVHGMISITAGCAVLSLSTKEPLLASRGSIVVIAACILWGIDNNLTRKISAGDPVEIAAAKGLIAGIVNIGVALMSGTSIPGVFTLLGSGLLGVLGYGVSLICFVLSLRRLGSARTAAYFSTAPFIGAFIGILVLGEGITVELLAGAVLMAVGVWLHITEHHHHEHGHAPFQHNHRHTHDEHHQHHDEDQLQPYGAHCHLHDHSRMLHSHPHFPDIHHRHGHSRDDAESE